MLVGLGLILPGITHFQTLLIPHNELGLMLGMISVLMYRLECGKYQNIGMNLILPAASAFLGGWSLDPQIAV